MDNKGQKSSGSSSGGDPSGGTESKPFLPQMADANGKLFTTGAIVRNKKTGEEFLVRGMFRQDEGPSCTCFASDVEVVKPRPNTPEELVVLIDESRTRGVTRPTGAVKSMSGGIQATGDGIIWGW